jgi:DNA-binding MarR family transcriptional regulator
MYTLLMSDASDFAECLDCKCAAARREAQRLTRLYDEKLRPHGLTVSQFTLLTTLIVGGPATMHALANRLGVARTTLTRNVALGEREGLVKTAAGNDARERVVSVSRQGRRKAEAALPSWRAAQAAAA